VIYSRLTSVDLDDRIEYCCLDGLAAILDTVKVKVRPAKLLAVRREHCVTEHSCKWRQQLNCSCPTFFNTLRTGDTDLRF